MKGLFFDEDGPKPLLAPVVIIALFLPIGGIMTLLIEGITAFLALVGGVVCFFGLVALLLWSCRSLFDLWSRWRKYILSLEQRIEALEIDLNALAKRKGKQ